MVKKKPVRNALKKLDTIAVGLGKANYKMPKK